MFNSSIHRKIYLLGIFIVAVTIPFSPFLLSLGQFILLGNWLFEFKFLEKWHRLKNRPSIMFFISIYLLHIIWLFNTTQFDYGIHDLKIKLPIIALPLILGTTEPLNKNEIKLIVHFFIASIMVASLYSLAIFLHLNENNPIDPRKISPVISHIRLSLYIVLSIYILISLIICNKPYQHFKPYVYSMLLIWLIGFSIFLGAFTGLIILFLVSPFALLFWLRSKHDSKKQITGIAIVSIFSVSILMYLGYSLYRYNDRIDYNTNNLPKYTVNNNRYLHYENNEDYENQYRVWLYVCEEELRKEWDITSEYKYDEVDKKGQPIRGTLMRYLTSYGYAKDSLGFSKLTQEDIRLIENGYANHIFLKRFSIYTRLYQIYWEIENYFKYGNPSGHSITQRIEYILNASRVIQRHFWLGTGTGDVKKEIDWQYEHDKSVLSEKWRLRAHNQYVTTFLTFGLLGFVIIVGLITIVLIKEKSNIDFIAFVFLCILFLSMINEDTLETQAGVHFCAFFFSFLIFSRKLTN